MIRFNWQQITSSTSKWGAYMLLCLSVHSTAICQSPTLVQPNQPFPFEVTLYGTDSVAHASTEVFGNEKKVTVLAFWLTTCPPCAAELEAYTRLYPTWIRAYDVRLLAISIDFPNRFAQIGHRVHDKHYPFPVWWDAHRVFKEIMPGGLNGLPQVFVFDKNGTLVWQHKGYQPGDENALLEQIQRAQ
jgi:cytochrome c biogenesis protein CcmG, thiol:disulfide interchange protein DsbE